MAYPILYINSTSVGASDATCSGAGPGDGVYTGSSLNGSSASVGSDGLTVTLSGSPDLTNVLTDGSHVLFLTDTLRSFGAIVGKDNTAKTVTITSGQNFTANATGLSWAIGGVRATLFNDSYSSKLLSNASATNTVGDAMPGWIIELGSGHTESTSGNVLIRQPGTTTDGCITIRGASGAANMPVITQTTNNYMIRFGPGATGWIVKGIKFINTNATKTASSCFKLEQSGLFIENCIFGDSSDSSKGWWRCVELTTSNIKVANCSMYYSSGPSIYVGAAPSFILCNYIYQSTGDGISVISGGYLGLYIAGNVIDSSQSCGINLTWTDTLNSRSMQIVENTIYNSVSDGLKISGNSASFYGLNIYNNVFSNNTGAGVNFSTAGVDSKFLSGYNVFFRNNLFYANSGGSLVNAGTPISYGADSVTANPSFANTSGKNFAVGANAKALAFPTANSNRIGSVDGATFTYKDIGASQRQEPNSSTSTSYILVHPGMNGGMRG